MFIPLINSLINKRSNYPYGETNGEIYKSDNGFSKLGTCTFPEYSGTVFEPKTNIKEISPVPIFILQHVMKMYFPDSEEK